MFMIFLCTWTVLHLNVPAVDDGFAKRLVRKIKWTMITMMLPEWSFSIAMQERITAKRQTEEIQSLRVPLLPQDKGSGRGWMLTHQFYTNIGRFLLRVEDRKPNGGATVTTLWEPPTWTPIRSQLIANR